MHKYHFVIVTIVVTTAFALWKGDTAARLAGALNLGEQVLFSAIVLTVGLQAGEVIALAGDGLWAVGLLLLAVRYASVWLGVTMLAQSAQFSLHAYYLVQELPHDQIHALINDFDNYVICGCIVLGTLLAMRRRVTLAREYAEREALRQKRSVSA